MASKILREQKTGTSQCEEEYGSDGCNVEEMKELSNIYKKRSVRILSHLYGPILF